MFKKSSLSISKIYNQVKGRNNKVSYWIYNILFITATRLDLKKLYNKKTEKQWEK